MEADVLLNAYIDLNLLLAVCAVMWLGLRWSLSRVGLGAAFTQQLRLLKALSSMLFVGPIVAIVLTTWVWSNTPNISDMLVTQFLHGSIQMSASNFETLIGARDAIVRDAVSQQSIWSQLAFGLFAAGLVVAAARVTLAAVRLKSILKGAHPWKRSGNLHILISDVARVAFSTRDLRNRYVILPSHLLTSPRDLRLTVAHEIQHFRQRDIEFEFLQEALHPLLFWNPAYYFWRNEMRRLREYACDQSVLKRGWIQARAYCECLIRASQFAAQRPVLFEARIPVVAMVERRGRRSGLALRKRILSVAALTDRNGPAILWATAASFAMVSVVASAIAIQRPADWSHDRIMLSTVVNLERLANRNATLLPQSPFQGGFVAAN